MRQRLIAAERAANASSAARAESKSDSDSGASARRVRELEHALAEAQEEGEKRVSETSQFQQMRKLMQSQSTKIRDLRRRLERYEPDCVKEDD